MYLHCEESSKLVVTTLGDSEPGSFLIYVSCVCVCPIYDNSLMSLYVYRNLI